VVINLSLVPPESLVWQAGQDLDRPSRVGDAITNVKNAEKRTSREGANALKSRVARRIASWD
jgi:hypothetical protein